ncbi:MAG: EAL domain-containing protein [Betaproteobacteria bacterium]|nr:EAL domain-containing protein [Betaproteobacteria bacterium]
MAPDRCVGASRRRSVAPGFRVPAARAIAQTSVTQRQSGARRRALLRLPSASQPRARHTRHDCSKRLPIAKLKVDRAFVSQLGVSREGEAVCRAIVALGRSLGVQVLAEGVETVEQMRALRMLGCVTLQGFLFARPVAADQVPAVIASAEARARAEASLLSVSRRATASGVRPAAASRTAMALRRRANTAVPFPRARGAGKG